jgi:hypothetical protein
MIDLKNAMALALEAPVDGGSAAERAAKEAATIEAWKAKRPGVPLYRARMEDALLLFAPADPEVAKELFARPLGSCEPEVLQQDMIRACLLHPTMDDLAEIAQHRPLLLLKLFAQCMSICGFGDDQDFKRADR